MGVLADNFLMFAPALRVCRSSNIRLISAFHAGRDPR
jgi:hypothetical protein